MAAHLLPYFSCAASRARSSSSEKGSFLTSGFNWLHHLQDTDTVPHLLQHNIVFQACSACSSYDRKLIPDPCNHSMCCRRYQDPSA
jgi:hypothetical protein